MNYDYTHVVWRMGVKCEYNDITILKINHSILTPV